MTSPLIARRDEFEVSTDPARLDVGAIHAFLSTESYWAAGIPREVVERSIRGSLCFGLYAGGRQIGFARAITDRATFAYLADVFVIEEFRGRGLGHFLMDAVLAHPELQGLRRSSLVTRDAHALYRDFGFGELASPSGWMEKLDVNVYRRDAKRGAPDDGA